MAITAKVTCSSKMTFSSDGTGSAAFTFYPDYADDRNKEWAAATPTLQLNLTVKNGDLFEVGKHYTLTFEQE